MEGESESSRCCYNSAIRAATKSSETALSATILDSLLSDIKQVIVCKLVEILLFWNLWIQTDHRESAGEVATSITLPVEEFYQDISEEESKDNFEAGGRIKVSGVLGVSYPPNSQNIPSNLTVCDHPAYFSVESKNFLFKPPSSFSGDFIQGNRWIAKYQDIANPQVIAQLFLEAHRSQRLLLSQNFWEYRAIQLADKALMQDYHSQDITVC